MLNSVNVLLFFIFLKNHLKSDKTNRLLVAYI